MAKKKSLKMMWIFIIVAVVVLAAVIYFMFFRSGTKVNDVDKNNPNGTTYQPPFPLKKGSNDNDLQNNTGHVHKVQAWLNSFLKVPYANLTLDGIWGERTEAAIKAKMGINIVTEDIYNKYVLTGTKLFKLK